jgi:uncharacterized protein
MWGKFMRRYPPLPLTTETIRAADGELLELHSLAGRTASPQVLLLHGLEGSPRSHYVGGLLWQAHVRGWSATLLVFRGCGSVPNEARRFYHSGETSDIATAFDHLRRRNPSADWLLVGVSLGGNVLLKWLGESAERVDSRIRAAAAISTPYDLEAGARYIGRGPLRVYDRSFLRSLRRKALVKLRRYPDLFERDGLLRARSVFDFDDVVTGPVHGFRNAQDYYAKSSSEQFLRAIRIPTMLISAADDPFIPRAVWERVGRAMAGHQFVRTDFSRNGGHVGFVSGRWPWRVRYYAEQRVYEFFEGVLKPRNEAGYD